MGRRSPARRSAPGRASRGSAGTLPGGPRRWQAGTARSTPGSARSACGGLRNLAPAAHSTSPPTCRPGRRASAPAGARPAARAPRSCRCSERRCRESNARSSAARRPHTRTRPAPARALERRAEDNAGPCPIEACEGGCPASDCAPARCRPRPHSTTVPSRPVEEFAAPRSVAGSRRSRGPPRCRPDGRSATLAPSPDDSPCAVRSRPALPCCTPRAPCRRCE